MAKLSAASSASSTQTAVRLGLILAAAFVLFALIAYYNKKKSERFSASADVQQQQQQQQQQQPMPYGSLGPSSSSSSSSVPMPSSPSASSLTNVAGPYASAAGPAPIEPTGNEKYLPVGMNDPAVGTQPKDPFPQDKITPEQLLPKDAANTKWAQVNPAGQGDVKDQNYLNAGYHLGFDTQGSSLRNASHDIRSSPPCPRYRVSIWQQSSIDPDLMRRPLE